MQGAYALLFLTCYLHGKQHQPEAVLQLIPENHPGLTAGWVATAVAIGLKFLAQGNHSSRKVPAENRTQASSLESHRPHDLIPG